MGLGGGACPVRYQKVVFDSFLQENSVDRHSGAPYALKIAPA